MLGVEDGIGVCGKEGRGVMFVKSQADNKNVKMIKRHFLFMLILYP